MRLHKSQYQLIISERKIYPIDFTFRFFIGIPILNKKFTFPLNSYYYLNFITRLMAFQRLLLHKILTQTFSST